MRNNLTVRSFPAIRGLLIAILLASAGCSTSYQSTYVRSPLITYEVDITNNTDDLFHVTVMVQNLSAEHNIYNFASTAPGTYSILDFGRFVTSFKAYDGMGNEIPVEQLATNKWSISDPEHLAILSYDIEDTFDAKVEENQVAPMSGTGIDSTYAAFNTFGILGYFQGLQSNPVRLKVHYNPSWTIGTAMDVDAEGYYVADTFDRLADSPVLVGNVTVARTKVNDIDVDVFVFSPDTAIYAQKVLSLANDVLQSAGAFIGYSPVPYYKFLFVLLDNQTFQRYGLTSAGALEHSYSSLYVLPINEQSLPQLRSTMAHEFMHILTPLNLHSEIIHSYNFAVPTPSEHLWLYEGVTEWVSDIMQLRSGLMTTEEYLGEMSNKLRINDAFDSNMSLSRMAQQVYTPEGGRQFGNVYNRGAVTAAMLDIRLLELSGGKKGLREVFLQLLDEYGKRRPFPEKDFFDVLVETTYPEIRQFVDDYIRGSKTLPYEEYMARLGFKYIAEKPSEDARPGLGAGITLDEDRNIVTTNVGKEAAEFGLKDGDIILKIFGEDLTLQNARGVLSKTNSMKIGDQYELVVKRGDRELQLTGTLFQRTSRHNFEEMGQLTDRQEFLRDRWLATMNR